MLREIRQELRRVRSLGGDFQVPPELRGWAWERPPVRPRANLGLGVSEVAFYSCCPSEALEVRLGKRRNEGEQLRLGSAVHAVFSAAVSDLRRSLATGNRPWDAAIRLSLKAWDRIRGLSKGVEGYAQDLVELYRALVAELAGEASSAYTSSPNNMSAWTPWLEELTIDGSPLGLSRRLRADAVMGNVVVEVKLGQSGRPWHEVQLAGYAMALESQLESPVDYGILVRVNLRPLRYEVIGIPLGETPRIRFLEARDSMIDELIQAGAVSLESPSA